VHRGQCLVRVEGAEDETLLSQGDLVLIPHGRAHTLTCRHTGPEDALPLDDVLVRSGFKGHGTLVFGAGEPSHDTQLICGHFAISENAGHVLFDKLPPTIHISDYGAEAGGWLEATLRVIGAEAGGLRLGGDLIALKMSEAIFAQALRTFIESADEGEAVLAGFADPQLSRALAAFHRNPADAWTVAALAREAGMSRTAFAQAFAAKMALSPMSYVTRWRMQIAREALAEGRQSLAEVAERAGYASESAFSRVFKAETGVSPAAWRRSRGA
jgi:AraC-like DNA-binding protein